MAGILIELELRHARIVRILMDWFVRVGNYQMIAEADGEAERALEAILRRIAPKIRPLDPKLASFVLFHNLRNMLGTAAYRAPDLLRSPAAHEEVARLMYGYLRPD